MAAALAPFFSGWSVFLPPVAESHEADRMATTIISSVNKTIEGDRFKQWRTFNEDHNRSGY
ncbi:hypothetical protein [Cohnella nanjingensis]|uniref:hypothetical protein n=1 Tax=Cohnella nanjingensis TaxID=1387779 RepID=UPI001C878543|nr:hypothetical protein [Cohnella nanjingensis]